MTDHDAIERLRVEILEVFSPGIERDAWLAWLAQLVTDPFWQGDSRAIH
jgi:hypothetical protein